MILALDASTTRGSVALVSDHEPLREIFIDSPRGRGGALFSALEKIVGEAADIERVIVGVGPGSYNGIRSALAVAWGIATARGIPLVGISSLLGLDEGSYCAVGDARRGQVPTLPGSAAEDSSWSRNCCRKPSSWFCSARHPIFRSSRPRLSSFFRASWYEPRAQPDWLVSRQTGNPIGRNPSTSRRHISRARKAERNVPDC